MLPEHFFLKRIKSWNKSLSFEKFAYNLIISYRLKDLFCVDTFILLIQEMVKIWREKMQHVILIIMTWRHDNCSFVTRLCLLNTYNFFKKTGNFFLIWNIFHIQTMPKFPTHALSQCCGCPAVDSWTFDTSLWLLLCCCFFNHTCICL